MTVSRIFKELTRKLMQSADEFVVDFSLLPENGYISSMNDAATAETPAKFQFGPVRSARSVFSRSTEDCRNSLIVFDFSGDLLQHRSLRFGSRFSIKNGKDQQMKNYFEIFGLRNA